MRKALSAGLVVLVWAVLIDILSAYALFYYFQLRGYDSPKTVYGVDGRAPSIALFNKLRSIFAHRFPEIAGSDCRSHDRHGPLYRSDPVFGYVISTGFHEIIQCPLDRGLDKSYRWSFFIEDDGARRAGYRSPGDKPRVYLFGDSWIFGWALNDEQTAAWLLQDYFYGSLAIRNLSFPGGGSIQELIYFRQLAAGLGPQDTLVLGYADYYKERNVAAPSRLAAEAAFTAYHGVRTLKHLRARLADERVVVDFVPMDCGKPIDYCAQPDPAPQVMDEVTIAIYKEIVENSKARVAILFHSGSDDDPVVRYFRRAKVPIIDVRPEKAKFFTNDSVRGYDNHPGPVAHFAYYTAIREFIEPNRPRP